MKINNLPNISSFGAKKILPVTVQIRTKQNGSKPMRGHFCEIQPTNQEDVKIMMRILKNWKGKHSDDDFARTIAGNFLYKDRSDVKYYGVALDKKESDAYGNFCSLIQTTNPHSADKSNFEIYYIQSAPKIISPRQGKKPPIGGAGANAILGAVSIAEANGFEKVELLSCNDGFYKNIGFEKVPVKESKVRRCYGTVFRLPAQKFEEFKAKIKERYSSNS